MYLLPDCDFVDNDNPWRYRILGGLLQLLGLVVLWSGGHLPPHLPFYQKGCGKTYQGAHTAIKSSFLKKTIYCLVKESVTVCTICLIVNFE